MDVNIAQSTWWKPACDKHYCKYSQLEVATLPATLASSTADTLVRAVHVNTMFQGKLRQLLSL